MTFDPMRPCRTVGGLSAIYVGPTRGAGRGLVFRVPDHPERTVYSVTPAGRYFRHEKPCEMDIINIPDEEPADDL